MLSSQYMVGTAGITPAFPALGVLLLDEAPVLAGPKGFEPSIFTLTM